MLVILLILFTSYCAQAQLENYKQSSGYVDVREGAHMFYWLFYTTAPVKNYTERPLMIWLQGGPGNSATGYGNFYNVGPLTVELKERNNTLVKYFNVMFIDNPVGTGFSYVDDVKLLTKTNSEIATDFMVFIKKFYQKNPEFKKVPLYLYGQTYGSKMAVDIAIKLNDAESQGKIKSKLRGIILENPLVSPLDHVKSWPRILEITALVEEEGYAKVLKAANKTEMLFKKGQYLQSQVQRNATIKLINEVTSAVDINNFFREAYTTIPETKLSSDAAEQKDSVPQTKTEYQLDALMNNVVKKALNISEKFVWKLTSDEVYDALTEDFMKPVVGGIEKLLNKTNVIITTVIGNYGLLCTSPGQKAWISKMKWSGAKDFKKQFHNPMWVNGFLEGYQKKYGNFLLYELNGQGLDIPEFNLEIVREVLRNVTTFG